MIHFLVRNGNNHKNTWGLVFPVLPPMLLHCHDDTHSPESPSSRALMSFISVFIFHRVLLRVRMLYYLKAEILGEAADKAFEGTPAR